MIACPACGFHVQEGEHQPGIRAPETLAGRERKLFALFALNLGRVVSYLDICLALWPADDPHRWMAAIRVYVCRLRKKLVGYVITVEEGLGYRMRAA